MNRFRPGVLVPMVQPAGYGPLELRSAYNIRGEGSSRTVIAVVDAYDLPHAEKDLGVYRAAYGLPPCTVANGCFTKYNQSGIQGNYPIENVGWEQEIALDLEMQSAMCPNCRIILVEANTPTYGDLAAAENVAAAAGAHAIGNSYSCGEFGSVPFASAWDHPGVAITAASGDYGYYAVALFPADTPTVIGTGGTTLTPASTARGWAESAWSGAGSGCSEVYPKPRWQTDPLCPTRTVADVSADADPDTGVAVYAPVNATTSAWLVFGGTSVSTQVIAGIYGENGAPLVRYGPHLYANTDKLNDVTKGANGICGGTYLCTAGVGYDGPTGLGTPNGPGAF
jgi:subtilase family serine protease